MLKNRILYIVLLHCIFSCQNKTKTTAASTEINITMDEKVKSLCSLAKQIQFVTLQKTKDSSISRIKQAKIVGDKLFIHDEASQSILIFNYPSGRFLSKIKSIVNSDGEFLTISRFDINKTDQTVNILDGRLKKLFKFKYDGTFLSYKDIPFYTINYTFLGDNRILFGKYAVSDNPDLNYQLIKTDTNLNVINSTAKIDVYTSTFISPGNQYSYTHDGIIFLPINSPYAYQITDSSISTKYYLNFHEHWNDKLLLSDFKSPSELLGTLNRKKLVYGLGLIDGGNSLVIEYNYQNQRFTCIYDKRSKELFTLKDADFELLHKSFFIGYFDSKFLTFKNVTDLQKVLKDPDNCLDQKSRKMISNLKLDGNPVLILINL